MDGCISLWVKLSKPKTVSSSMVGVIHVTKGKYISRFERGVQASSLWNNMCQARPRAATNDQDQEQQQAAAMDREQQQLYPNLTEFVDSLIPPEEEEGSRHRRRQQGALALLEAALAHYLGSGEQVEEEEATRPSAPPMTQQDLEEEQQQQRQAQEEERREQERQQQQRQEEALRRRRHQEGRWRSQEAWNWWMGVGDWHQQHQQEEENRRRRQEECCRRAAAAGRAFLGHAAFAASRAVSVVLALLPLLLLPHWVVAQGLFLAVATSLGWSLGHLAAAAIVTCFLNNMCGFLLRILAAAAVFKTLVLRRPLVNRSYFRRRMGFV